jgi:hypothetical protein
MDIAYIKVTVDEHRFNKVCNEINEINGVVTVDELKITEEEC